MGLKNINIFEQHVEKIVLAVAFAGAAFMGYLAVQKVTLENDPEVGPHDVEQKITDEITRMDRQRDALDAEGKPQPQVPRFYDSYMAVAGAQPLDQQLVKSGAPILGPTNLRTQTIDVLPENTVAAVIPDPVPPELLRAEALQLQVSTAPQVDGAGLPLAPGTTVTVPTGMQLATQTRNVVVIDGYVPVGKMVLQMANEKNPTKRFTSDVQRGIVYRVRVYRKELQSNGSYSKPELVTPPKGFSAPDDLLVALEPGTLGARLTDIDNQFQQIQLPNYYVDAMGVPVLPPILLRPIPATIADETARLHTEIQNAQAGGSTGGFRPVAPVVPVPGTPGAPAMFPTTVELIRALEVQPFTAWDDSVKPDHTYIYSVKIELVNPGYGWKWGLEKPSMKLEPVIAAATMEIRPPVVVHSDLAFFINGADSTGRINGLIFKQKNGRWYQTTFNTDKGNTIAAQMTIDGKSEEVDTNFALVDSQGADKRSSIVLKDPVGNLVTRNAEEDWGKIERTELAEKVKKGTAAAAAAATQAGVDPMMNPTLDNLNPTPIPTRGTTPPARGPVPVNRP